MSNAPVSAPKPAAGTGYSYDDIDHSEPTGHGNSPAAWTTVFVMLVGAAAVVIADPLAAAQGSIAAATGITGSDVKVDVTVFPVLAVVAGALLGLSALLIIPAGRYWKSRTKYDTAATSGPAGGSAAPAGPADEIESWDRLSRGDDPT